MYRQAAARGIANAQIMLGLKYAQGHGVARDPVQAYKWLYIAAEGGSNLAKKALQINSQGMTPAQMDEAVRLAKEEKIIKEEQ